MNKKILGAVLACAVVIPTTLGFTGCCGNATPTKAAARDVYSLAAVSSAEYLQSLGGNTPVNTTIGGFNFAEAATARPTTITDADVNNINRYLGMFEDLLKNNGLNYQTAAVTEADGADYQQFKTKMSMSLPTVDGGTQSFVMYYKETAVESEDVVEADEDDPEVSTKLDGVLILGEEKFDITGEREVEGDEVEIEFTTKSKANPTNYIVVKQSVENNEIEYEYIIYENGVIVSQSEIEFETENNEAELSLQFKTINASDPTKSELNETEFEIKKKENSTDTFKVEYYVNNAKNEFTIKLEGDKAIFTYANGFVEQVDRI